MQTSKFASNSCKVEDEVSEIVLWGKKCFKYFEII